MEKQLPGLAPQHLHLGEEGEGEKPTEPRPKGKARFPGLTLSLCPSARISGPWNERQRLCDLLTGL